MFFKVVEDLKDRVQRLPNFKQRLIHTRKRLLSLQSIENKRYVLNKNLVKKANYVAVQWGREVMR
jgi:hypothetical protein